MLPHDSVQNGYALKAPELIKWWLKVKVYFTRGAEKDKATISLIFLFKTNQTLRSTDAFLSAPIKLLEQKPFFIEKLWVLKSFPSQCSIA